MFRNLARLASMIMLPVTVLVGAAIGIGQKFDLIEINGGYRGINSMLGRLEQPNGIVDLHNNISLIRPYVLADVGNIFDIPVGESDGYRLEITRMQDGFDLSATFLQHPMAAYQNQEFRKSSNLPSNYNSPVSIRLETEADNMNTSLPPLVAEETGPDDLNEYSCNMTASGDVKGLEGVNITLSNNHIGDQRHVVTINYSFDEESPRGVLTEVSVEGVNMQNIGEEYVDEVMYIASECAREF